MRVRASAGAASFHRHPTLEEHLAEAKAQIEALKAQARAMARELDVRGLMNVQFAVPRDGRVIFILR